MSNEDQNDRSVGGRQHKPIAQVSDMRFKKRELDTLLKTTGLKEATTVGQDARGHFIEAIDPQVEDPLDRMVKGLLGRLREGGQVSISDPRSKAKRGPVEHQSPAGVCARVRQWAAENPKATVQEAVAHFKDANPTTVRIQFKKAHG